MVRVLGVAFCMLASPGCGKSGTFGETDASGESTGEAPSCLGDVEIIERSGEVELSWTGGPVSDVVVRENIGGVIGDGLLWWISCEPHTDCIASPVLYGDQPDMTHTLEEPAELTVGEEYMVVFRQGDRDPSCSDNIFVVELQERG